MTLAGPGAANAGTYGIQPAPFEVQAESDVWAMWLPCTFGYAMWLACLVVRMRNLVTIHLRGGTPLAALFQVGALWLPCLIASSPGGTVSNVLWLLILAAAAVYYAILCCRLRHLRHDLDDFHSNTIAGLGTIALTAAKNVLQLVGVSYANPPVRGRVGSQRGESVSADRARYEDNEAVS